MGQLNAPTQLEKGLKALFLSRVAMEPPTLVSRIATVVPSEANNEKYTWLGQSPQMTEQEGEVEFSDVSDTGYTLTNRLFSAGLLVKRTDIEDDQTTGIMRRISQLAEVGARHPNKLLIDSLINGTDAVLGASYDGVSFFNDAHPERNEEGGTQDNLAAGTGTSTAQVAADLNTVLATMGDFKAENGEPFHEQLTQIAIVAPNALRKSLSEAISAGIIANTSNVQFTGMTFDMILSARLADANDYYVLHVGSSVRPLIFQDRVPLTFESETEGSVASFDREQYRYKTRARRETGYAFWQDAIKVVNA